MRTIFGPVPSRRLGRSLGIDVVAAKTCSYDCLYCESGPTTHLTLQRQLFVAPDQVLCELDDYFGQHPEGADVLTFSSAGEPTLYLGLGCLLEAIKLRFPQLPLVVLTNGSLLGDPEVREELRFADRVVPSLDAVDDEVFRRLNRPHPNIDVATVIEGLRAFRRDYRGQFHLEIMLVAGFNDHDQHLRALARVAESLNPNRIELNTVVRPPACPGIRGLSPLQMRMAAQQFSQGRTEIIGKFAGHAEQRQGSDLTSRVCDLLRRRPCTAEEMVESLAVSREALENELLQLEREGIVRITVFAGCRFFQLTDHQPC